ELFWKGSLPSDRTRVAGWAIPREGMEVCSEGSRSFQKCGVIQITGWPHSEFGSRSFLYAGDCGVVGDSGGPIIRPTIYRPIAVGLVLGIEPVKGTSQVYCAGTSVADVAAALDVVPNTATS